MVRSRLPQRRVTNGEQAVKVLPGLRVIWRCFLWQHRLGGCSEGFVRHKLGAPHRALGTAYQCCTFGPAVRQLSFYFSQLK